jgi:hypothetical protein
VDRLQAGTRILCSSDEGTQTRLEEVSFVEEIE